MLRDAAVYANDNLLYGNSADRGLRICVRSPGHMPTFRLSAQSLQSPAARDWSGAFDSAA